jgi:hypothetical protein
MSGGHEAVLNIISAGQAFGEIAFFDIAAIDHHQLAISRCDGIGCARQRQAVFLILPGAPTRRTCVLHCATV